MKTDYTTVFFSSTVVYTVFIQRFFPEELFDPNLDNAISYNGITSVMVVSFSMIQHRCE